MFFRHLWSRIGSDPALAGCESSPRAPAGADPAPIPVVVRGITGTRTRPGGLVIKPLYWAFSYLGLMSVAAAFITGFRHDASAPLGNLVFDVALYAVFIAVHIVMTMPAFKRAVFGRPEGVPVERRIYIVVSVLTWLGVFWWHEPVPGLAFTSPAWL